MPLAVKVKYEKSEKNKLAFENDRFLFIKVYGMEISKLQGVNIG